MYLSDYQAVRRFKFLRASYINLICRDIPIVQIHDNMARFTRCINKALSIKNAVIKLTTESRLKNNDLLANNLLLWNNNLLLWNKRNPIITFYRYRNKMTILTQFS